LEEKNTMVELISRKRPSQKVTLIKRKRKKIKVPKGRWCETYEGRMPGPTECAWNKLPPFANERPQCRTCKRYLTYDSWKGGDWREIKRRVLNGEDLSEMESPIIYKDDLD